MTLGKSVFLCEHQSLSVELKMGVYIGPGPVLKV